MITKKQRNLRQSISFPKIEPKTFYDVYKWCVLNFETIFFKLSRKEDIIPLGGILLTVMTEAQLSEYYPDTFQKLTTGTNLNESELKQIISPNNPLPLTTTTLNGYSGYVRIN
jgi:hypothetical protein